MNNLEKEFAPYEESFELKKLGFDEPCFTYYKNDQLSDILELVKNSEMENVNNEVDDYISAPTFSQAFRWFREKYNLAHRITISSSKFISYDITEVKEHSHKSLYFTICSLDGANTYEGAELACLKKLIEIVKNTKP